ncbi:tyrosine--tRNA ligase [Kineosporia succinea]|uniref:tyrosine--tRNA ligase n=1 Tax=Kineosporia succinea TaxID=84632 RepID=UPI003522C85F
MSTDETVTSATAANVLDELKWRNLLANSTDEAELRKAFGAGPVTYYIGFDPTGPSLHIGHLVQVLTMRRLQEAGHRPLALVGGATGLIGDPRPSSERVLNSPETVANWVERLRGQIEPFLDFTGPNAATMVNNLDWTSGLGAIEFLRDVGKHFRVGKMLAKDAVSARLNSEAGISYTEFSYQILQSMDFLELNKRHGCTLQLGGSDQWGNLTAGLDLIHRVRPEQNVHCLATPLITKADGSKFGKSEGGAVWLDPEMTSPYAFFQFWLNAEDAKIADYLRVFTFRSAAEIDELAAAPAHTRSAQRALAHDMTALVHGDLAATRVEDASKALFGGGDVAGLDPRTLSDALGELPKVTLARGEHLVADLLVATGLAKSKSDARRTLNDGGASVNNVKVTDGDAATVSTADLVHDRWILLRKGRRSLAAVELAGE